MAAKKEEDSLWLPWLHRHVEQGDLETLAEVFNDYKKRKQSSNGSDGDENGRNIEGKNDHHHGNHYQRNHHHGNKNHDDHENYHQDNHKKGKHPQEGQQHVKYHQANHCKSPESNTDNDLYCLCNIGTVGIEEKGKRDKPHPHKHKQKHHHHHHHEQKPRPSLTDSSGDKDGNNGYHLPHIHHRVKDGDVNEVYQGRNPLLLAVTRNSVDIVSLLLSNGANPNVICHKFTGPPQNKTKIVWSAIHEACSIGSVECLSLLLGAGCDVNLRADGDLSPLHVAAWSRNPLCLNLLIDSGCDVNQLARGGESALVHPVCLGSHEVVHALLTAGCKYKFISLICPKDAQDMFSSTHAGTTDGIPLDLARRPCTLLQLAVLFSQPRVGVLLLQHGYDPNNYSSCPQDAVLPSIWILMKRMIRMKEGENKDLISAECMTFLETFFAAGYDLKPMDEKKLLEARKTYSNDSGHLAFLLSQCRVVRSLHHLSRLVVRACLKRGRNTSLVPGVLALDIPRSETTSLLLGLSLIPHAHAPRLSVSRGMSWEGAFHVDTAAHRPHPYYATQYNRKWEKLPVVSEEAVARMCCLGRFLGSCCRYPKVWVGKKLAELKKVPYNANDNEDD